MSARRRSSILPNLRYHPFAAFYSPIRALRQVVAQVCRFSTTRRPLPAQPTLSHSLSGNRLANSGHQLSDLPHDSTLSTNGLTILDLTSLVEDAPSGTHEDNALSCRLKSACLCDVDNSGLCGHSPMHKEVDAEPGKQSGQKAVAAVFDSLATAGSSTKYDPFEKCTRWLENIEQDLEEGELMDDSGLVVQSWASITPSVRSLSPPVRGIRKYHFFDLVEIGNLKFSPPLEEPTHNRWTYLPPGMKAAPGIIRDIGDIEFTMEGDRFVYYVYWQAPGTDSHYERYWIQCSVGDPHPHKTGYVLHHHFNQAPLWLYQAGKPLYPPIILRDEIILPPNIVHVKSGEVGLNVY